MKDETEGLTQLGSKETEYRYSAPTADMLEVIGNPYPSEVYKVKLYSEEFTSLCPKTGQPDFAKILVRYHPRSSLVETKSFKLYLFAFRNYKGFMERITNKIFEDLMEACNPVMLEIKADFNLRGGISLSVERYGYGKAED